MTRFINQFLDKGGILDWDYPKPLDLADDEIIGVYSSNNEQISIVADNDGLLNIHLNGKNVGLYKLNSNFYYAPGIDSWVWFTQDDNKNLNIHCSSIYELKVGIKNSSQQRI